MTCVCGAACRIADRTRRHITALSPPLAMMLLAAAASTAGTTRIQLLREWLWYSPPPLPPWLPLRPMPKDNIFIAEKDSRMRSAVLPAAAEARWAAVFALVLKRDANSCSPTTAGALSERGHSIQRPAPIKNHANTLLADLRSDC